MLQRQLGIGLIEILLSLLIGSFLMAGMISLFTNNKRTYLYQQAQGMEAEAERFAARVFSQLLRQAGHSPFSTEAVDGKHMLFTNNPSGSDYEDGQVLFGTRSIAATATTAAVSGSITYRYAAGEEIVTCAGENFPVMDAGTPTNTVFVTQREETIRLDNNGNLICEGRNLIDTTWDATPKEIILIGDMGVPHALQIEVSSLSFTYGVDVSGNGSVDYFTDATKLNDASTYTALTLSPGEEQVIKSAWQRVKLVNVAMTVRSGNRSPQKKHFTIELSNLLETPE